MTLNKMFKSKISALNVSGHFSTLCMNGFTVIVQKVKFCTKDSLNKCDQMLRKLWIWQHLMETVDLATFNEEILYVKLYFRCNDPYINHLTKI